MNGPDVLMPLERFGIRFVAAPRLARRATPTYWWSPAR
jgi:hypothetical protein